MPDKRDINKELRILLENSPLGIVLTDRKGKFLFVNRSFQNMLGYNKAELLSMSVVDITHPDSIEKSLNMMGKAFDSGSYVSVEKQYLHKDGSIIDAQTRIAVVLDDDGNSLYYCTNIENITEQKKVHQQLAYMACHDDLTGLVNRREFERRAKCLMEDSERNQNEHLLMFMDLDHFKIVNDTFGHAAGDELLRQISHVLENTLSPDDTLGRLGGDEFGVLIEKCSLSSGYPIALSIQEAIRDFRFSWQRKVFKVGISIGIVSINQTSVDLSITLSDADAACYLAKDQGHNHIYIHNQNDIALAKRHEEMQSVVRVNEALEENRFCLFAQTIKPLNGKRGNYCELLLRMLNEKGDIIPPHAFLPAAERYHIITKLDQWVIDKVFDYFVSDRKLLENMQHISINLSGQSLTSPDFLLYVIDRFNHSSLPAKKICFEITETAAISNINTATIFIEELKALGCYFAIDDFGSGLSSFGYLKKLPVNYLKIDGMFVKDIVNNPIDYAMVKSINEIGQVMGMETIAEFVENDNIKQRLQGIGVQYAQGYGIAKPLPLEKLKLHETAHQMQ